MKRIVEKQIPSIPASDGAGVRLNRLIGTGYIDQVDPFLMLDEFRSDDPNDYIAGFPEHPHRGFETVTYMLAGAMEHKDSVGNEGRLGPGDIQWMTAGKGIIHSEMPRQEQGLMWGFQLWVNLPAKDKMCKPQYQEVPAGEIPVVDLGSGTKVKLICGEYKGQKAAVSTKDREIVYWDITLDDSKQTLQVPEGHQGFMYVYEGEMEITGTTMKPNSLAVLSDGDEIELAAKAGRALLVLGKPIDEPIARHGPFVMNTRQQIEEAVQDYMAGRFTD